MAIWETWGIWVAIWGIEIKPQHQRVIAKLNIFIYNFFKVVGGYFAINTPFNPQLTPLKTLFKEPFALAFFRVLYKKPFRCSHILDAQNVKLKFLLAHIF